MEDKKNKYEPLPESAQSFFRGIIKFCMMAEYVKNNFPRRTYDNFIHGAHEAQLEYLELWIEARQGYKVLRANIEKEFKKKIQVINNRKKPGKV